MYMHVSRIYEVHCTYVNYILFVILSHKHHNQISITNSFASLQTRPAGLCVCCVKKGILFNCSPSIAHGSFYLR